MNRFKFRVNHGVWFTPKEEFISEWAAWIYIKAVFGDLKIHDFKIVRAYPEMLRDQNG